MAPLSIGGNAGDCSTELATIHPRTLLRLPDFITLSTNIISGEVFHDHDFVDGNGMNDLSRAMIKCPD